MAARRLDQHILFTNTAIKALSAVIKKIKTLCWKGSNARIALTAALGKYINAKLKYLKSQ